ncbi:hypothetical protein BGX34_000981 [Mortierella sp. NVP85]|nr:hypothetical protein BGX34_000981 [Mortierella sp. NVP85]
MSNKCRDKVKPTRFTRKHFCFYEVPAARPEKVGDRKEAPTPTDLGKEFLENYRTRFVNQDDDNGVLEANLIRLRAELERDLSRFMDGTEEKLLIEILLIL